MNVINLFFMLKIALKNWVALALAAVITAGVAYGYVNFIAEPKYSAGGAVMVTNGTIMPDGEFVEDDTKLQNSDIVASINFADTVADILKTSGLYQKLAEETDGKYTFGELKSRTSVSRRKETNSLYIDVTFTATTPQEAIIVLNKLLQLTPDYIGTKVKNASVTVEYADNAGEVYMNDITLIMVAAIAGAAVVYLIIFLIYSSDTVIRDEESFKDHMDIPVIGVVPDFANSKSAERKYYRYGRYYGYKNYYGYGGKK